MARLAALALLALAPLCACAPDEEPELPADPEVPQDVAYCDAVREWDPAWTAVEDEVVVLLNERRAAGATCGEEAFEPTGPLTMDPALRCAARHHAKDLAEQDYFSNVDPDGLSFVERAAMAGYAGTALGQNIGATHATAERIVDSSMDFRDLCAHIMNPEADEVGVGWAEIPASYPRYWVQAFGASAAAGE